MGVLSEFKAAIDMAKSLGNTELYRQVLDLQARAIELAEENINLREQVRTLEESISLKAKVRISRNWYMVESADGSEDGPFCMGCYDTTSKLIRLYKKGWEDDRFSPMYECHTCKVKFYVSEGEW